MKSCYVCAKPTVETFCPSCQPQNRPTDLQQVLTNGPRPAPLPESIHAVQEEDPGPMSIGYDMLKKEEQTIKSVEKAGFTVIRSDRYHLLLDLDGRGAIAKFDAMLKMVKQAVIVNNVVGWESKSNSPSNPRWHVVVQLADPLDLEIRLFLQQILGDDPRRGILSLRKYKELDIEEPCLLFKPPNAISITPLALAGS